MKEANEKILDRIRKLLAMAKDSSSPNEAAIAAGRARKLMDEYQVSELDLTSIDVNEFGKACYDGGFKWRNTAMGWLALAIGRLNDCVVDYERDFSTDHLNLRFKGFLADAVSATEMLSYLHTEMDNQAKIAVPNGMPRTRADRNAFRLGFASGVKSQVDELMRERNKIQTSNGTDLVIVKNQMVAQKFGMQKTSNGRTNMSGSGTAYQQGVAAGRSANLGHQVSESKNRLTH